MVDHELDMAKQTTKTTQLWHMEALETSADRPRTGALPIEVKQCKSDRVRTCLARLEDEMETAVNTVAIMVCLNINLLWENSVQCHTIKVNQQ